MNDAPWSAYMALDGPHLDGLIGSAGVLRFDWPERKFHFKHFEGISAAHNVSPAPNAQIALLGNFSQQIVVLDISRADNIREIRRQSTMHFEQAGYRLRANTHHLWYPDNKHFICAIGDQLCKFDVDDLQAPERLGSHRLENAHELRWDASRRYVLIGDLGPERFDVRQVCVFDLQEPDPEKRARLIRVQNNVWHNCVHPTKPLGYALTYSFTTDSEDYIAWSPAYVREYIYEIDLPTAQIVRTWSCGAEFPIHLNSDVEATEDALYIASGGGHGVVRVDLNSFSDTSVTLTMPSWFNRFTQWPKRGKNLLGAFSRKSAYNSSHYILQTLQVTNWRLVDGVYATRVSPDGKYVMVGHRGYNYIAVHERATMKNVYGRVLPFRRDVYRAPPYHRFGWRGHHLGIHHSAIVART